MIQTPDSRVWNKSWCSCVRCGSLPFTDCNILKHVCPQVLWSSFLQAKEELQSIFPLSHENHSCGNALERVLALEIELAEALRGKQKQSTIHFQRYMVLQELERTILNTELTPFFFAWNCSSFLKQHTDDEAIFQSFRDINDLIEEMLATKGRYASIETELKEMHDRYSQLSLKFAEVEGERQKLMLTLKNVRASKKGTGLNRSSSATLGEH